MSCLRTRLGLPRVLMIAICGVGAAGTGPPATSETAPSPEIVQTIRNADPSLTQFSQFSTVPIDDTHALVTVSASPIETRPEDERSYPLTTRVMGVAVAEKDVPVLLLDMLVRESSPRKGYSHLRGYRIDRLSDEQVTFLVDDDFYGTWITKIKVFFDIKQRKVLGKHEVGFFPVNALAIHEGIVWAHGYYDAPSDAPSPSFHGILQLPCAPDGGAPRLLTEVDANPIPQLDRAVSTDDGVVLEGPEYRCILRDRAWSVERHRIHPDIIRVAMPSPNALQEEELDLNLARNAECLPEGGRFLVAPGGVVIINADREAVVYPVEDFEYSLLREKRQDPQIARNPNIEFELQNFIGAWQLVGDEIVFGNDFYDGEGLSGIGSLGYFDLVTKTYRYEFLDRLASWSTAAILVDRDEIWIAMKRQPEGKDYSGGILKYNSKNKSVAHYELPHVALTMATSGDTRYIGTEDGLYILSSTGLTRVGATVTLDRTPALYRDVLSRGSNP